MTDNPQINKVYYRPNGKPYVKRYEHEMFRKGQLYDTILEIKAKLLEKTGQDVPLKIIYLVIKYFIVIITNTLTKGLAYKIRNLGVFKPQIIKERLRYNLGGKDQWRKLETHLSYSFNASEVLKKKLRGTLLTNADLLDNLPDKEKEKLNQCKNL